MSGTLAIEGEDFERLLTEIQRYGEGAADTVTEVVHESGDLIYDEIDPLINPSGRTFRGHSSGAKGTSWQRYDKSEALAITVSTVSSRHYLYFPDDGSSTKRHYGDQQFMLKGAASAAPAILDKGIDALVRKFERS